jgi:hypothetical protein
MAVSLVTDRAYQAIMRRDRSALKREDLLLTGDVPRIFERDLVLPRGGSYWFIIENQSGNEVEIHIQCSDLAHG